MRLDRLVRLISQQWAIEADVLENWCQILDAKLSGHSIPDHLLATEEQIAAAGNSSRGGDEPFVRDGNLAIIPVVGTLVKANTWFSCDATYAQLQKAMTAAAQAKGIEAMMLHGDTPGGTVAGVQEAGDFIAKMNKRMPVYGYADDLTASAGYWLLSQTRMIGSHAASDIGSIGVLTVHYDRSQRDAQYGVKRTVLAVGDMKAAGNDTEPLDKETTAYIMERLQQTYGLFIGAVNKGRPQLSADHIRSMQSRVYKAGQAKEQGLIDHVMGRDEYVDHIKRNMKGAVTVGPGKGARAMSTTIETLRADHADLISQIEAAARENMIAQADHESALATARTEATTAARTNLLALHGAIFGDEASQKFTAAVESGITADQAKTLGISAGTGESSASHQAILEALAKVAPTGLKPGQVEHQKSAAIDTSAIYASRQPK